MSVYLDATHTAWQNVGESADRLVKAGVQRAAGFFVNASNYQYTPNLSQYGTWVSQCLAYATTVNPGDYNGCPNQYWNGGPSNGWTGVALNNYGVWSDTATEADLNTLGVNERYASMLGGTTPTAHFVVDTSRNGQGPWKPPAGVYPDAQDWCNPPGRGLGDRPTTVTGNPLMDAKLWIKTPGQSDGQCNRGVAGATTDPEWGGITDPAAGDWFPAQALQLAQLAAPPLLGSVAASGGRRSDGGQSDGGTTSSDRALSPRFSSSATSEPSGANAATGTSSVGLGGTRWPYRSVRTSASDSSRLVNAARAASASSRTSSRSSSCSSVRAAPIP